MGLIGNQDINIAFITLLVSCWCCGGARAPARQRGAQTATLLGCTPTARAPCVSQRVAAALLRHGMQQLHDLQQHLRDVPPKLVSGEGGRGGARAPVREAPLLPGAAQPRTWARPPSAPPPTHTRPHCCAAQAGAAGVVAAQLCCCTPAARPPHAAQRGVHLQLVSRGARPHPADAAVRAAALFPRRAAHEAAAAPASPPSSRAACPPGPRATSHTCATSLWRMGRMASWQRQRPRR